MEEVAAGGLAALRCAVLHGRGLAAVATLPGLLAGVRLLRPGDAQAAQAQAVLAWGRKPSAQRAQSWAARHGLPLVCLEDGFLRSVGLGPDEPPLSVVPDDLGIYYDAHSPSRLEQLIREPLAPEQLARAQALRQRWCEAAVSKYNQGREWRGELRPDDVLVVDQTAGDASIDFGLAGPASFSRMLEAALDEHPRARILLKVHPDVVAGRKQGHFGALSAAQRARITWLGEPVHPVRLLAGVGAVYVVTSQMGFEALLWGLPVRCFGMPFYAGWGWTGDELPAPPRRGAGPGLEALVHAALVAYPRYLDPETGLPCSPERLIDWLGLQRQQRERFPAHLNAVGFSGWKRPMLRRFMAGSTLHFVSAGRAARSSLPVVLWGRRGAPTAPGVPVIRVEDGFLRSVGLGADLVAPLSWVLDTRGLHYDASGPSDLEHRLNQGNFSPALLARARHLRERLQASGATKYNLGGAAWQRPAGAREVVLVVGQVESDAAILHGAPGIRTNMALLQAVRAQCPQAWVVYKPHPDVVARLRARGQGEGDAEKWCNEVALNVAMHTLLNQVDQVHVLTSLAGFEALLRGRRVVVWGCPFYAGWGLTEDQWPVARRERAASLDELTAAVLIAYPTYVSRHTGHFATPERALDELLAWQAQAPAPAGSPALWRRGWRWVLRLSVALGRAWSRLSG